jgi:peptidoglycan/LPS O-acetylase OafA/YrhL
MLSESFQAVEAAPIYRRDIDGLRAIAVLLVIFHHYGIPGFGGGFVGVDVFFVISGYLIAAHIERDLLAGHFSLLAFYERRVRRIIPALFVMYALVLLAGALVLFPPDLHFFSGIGGYVVPFLANFALYRNAGVYGGQFADHVVLLHTWSLAVEEQFYLLFPLLMLTIWGLCRGRYGAVLWPLALLSLLACMVVVRIWPLAAFYLAPFRAWELLAGALLAVGKWPPPQQRSTRAGAAVAGLVLIAAADGLLSTDSPYPGELTLLPCAGAALIIHASCDQSMTVGRVLGIGFMRRIGQWSYSLYLYHWPLLLLVQYYALDPLSAPMRGLLLGATLLLGALSWRLVEQPFRGANAWLDRRSLFAAAALCGGVLMLATAGVHRATDPVRYDATERLRFPTQSAEQLRCTGSSPELVQRPVCVLGDRSARISAVVWGDSHAVAMLPALEAAFAGHHEAAMFAQSGRCPPLLGTYVRDSTPGQWIGLRSWMDAAGVGHGVGCKRHNDLVLRWVIQNRIPKVILIGHWIANTESRFLSTLTDAETPGNYSVKQNAVVFARGLERLLAVLQEQHVRVFLMADVPQKSLSVPYLLAAGRRLQLHRDLSISRADYETQQRSAMEIFARLQRHYAFTILRPQDILCAQGRCTFETDASPLYVDSEHLAITGAMLCAPALEPVFAKER